MTNQRNLGAVVAGYVASAAAYSQIPIPEWVGSGLGSPDIVRPLIALTLPTAALVMTLVFGSLFKRERTQPGDELSMETCQRIASRLVLYMIALHAVMLSGLVGASRWASQVVLVLVGITLMGIGNLLPRTRPNSVIGFRTALAVRNRQAWIRLHRAAGRVTVGAGVAVAIAALLPRAGDDFVIPMISLVAAGLLLFYSARQTDR